MNDLLQMKKATTATTNNNKERDNHNELQRKSQNTSVIQMNHCEAPNDNNNVGKIMKGEKSNLNHKRPSISYEISSKRVKAHDTIKTTPQLLQQLMSTSGASQKGRQRIQTSSTSTGNCGDALWTPVAPPKPSQPASNSVLMNLLVSGCDVSAGYYTCLPRTKVAKA
jgi:hypothetical protein